MAFNETIWILFRNPAQVAKYLHSLQLRLYFSYLICVVGGDLSGYGDEKVKTLPTECNKNVSYIYTKRLINKYQLKELKYGAFEAYYRVS